MELNESDARVPLGRQARTLAALPGNRLNKSSISHERAREAAHRIIGAAFKREDARPRFSIPTQASDDDVILVEYVEQQQELSEREISNWQLWKRALARLSIPEETPERVARWLGEYVGKSYPGLSLPEDISRAIVEDDHNEMVVVKDIQFTALCEHHLLPFMGRAAVGYIPHGRIIGLSKLARIVHRYVQYPTLQEHITKHVADCLQQALEPDGVMVVLYDVMHSCMSMRGIKEREATTTTSAVRGFFKEDARSRTEFLALLK